MNLSATSENRHRPVPGEPGVWVFVGGDLLIFSLFFLTYMYYRHENLALYAASQAKLDQTFGILNTFLMLSSSWWVASGVRAARADRGYLSSLCLCCGLLCGCGFIASKLFEYHGKLNAGITPLTNEFFTFYFMFTGIHLLHVLLAMILLVFMTRYTRHSPNTPAKVRNLESGACLWHLVDLIWIFLFALLYVLK